MEKRFICILLCLTMVFSISGCASKNKLDKYMSKSNIFYNLINNFRDEVYQTVLLNANKIEEKNNFFQSLDRCDNYTLLDKVYLNHRNDITTYICYLDNLSYNTLTFYKVYEFRDENHNISGFRMWIDINTDEELDSLIEIIENMKKDSSFTRYKVEKADNNTISYIIDDMILTCNNGYKSIEDCEFIVITYFF